MAIAAIALWPCLLVGSAGVLLLAIVSYKFFLVRQIGNPGLHEHAVGERPFYRDIDFVACRKGRIYLGQLDASIYRGYKEAPPDTFLAYQRDFSKTFWGCHPEGFPTDLAWGGHSWRVAGLWIDDQDGYWGWRGRGRGPDFVPADGFHVVSFPAWFLLIPPWAVVGWRYRRKRIARSRVDRRRQMGLCIHCGYDLRASAERCPECGAEIICVASNRPRSTSA